MFWLKRLEKLAIVLDGNRHIGLFRTVRKNKLAVYLTEVYRIKIKMESCSFIWQMFLLDVCVCTVSR